MGTWGPHSFDNDAACDFVVEVIDGQGGVRLLTDTLRRVIRRDVWTDAYEAERAVAAAELLAIARGFPQTKRTIDSASAEPDLSEELGLASDFLEGEVQAFCTSIPKTQLDELSKVAQSALEVVRKKSELPQLWEETDDTLWAESIVSLLKRLEASWLQ